MNTAVYKSLSAMLLSMDAALEDLNLLLADLDVDGLLDKNKHEKEKEEQGFTEAGVRPGGCQDIAFSNSCTVVIDQVNALESALGGGVKAGERVKERGGGRGAAATAGIVESAVARGMPDPAEGYDSSAVRYNCRH